MILSDIDQHWPVIKPGLCRVRQKTQVDWSDKDIRSACREGRAFLFTAPEGFVIVRPDATDVPRLHIWAAYGQGGNLIQQYQPFLEHLARDIGARALTFESTRKAYRRLNGWTRNGTIYTRVL